MTLGNIIRQYCAEHGVSQRQLAIKSGLTSGYISMLVNNLNPKTGAPMRPTIETYQKLADGMNMTLEHLFDIMDDAPVSLSPPSPNDDPDLWQLREAMRRNPELRALWSIQRKATVQQVQRMKDFAKGVMGDDAFDETDAP